MIGIEWVREFLGDVKKTLFGLVALGRHCLTRDELGELPLSLSQFSTATPHARVGVAKAYEIVLANTTDQHRWAQLVIDVFLKQTPPATSIPQGHMACVEKRIFVRRRTSQKVRLVYNWRERLSFELDGEVFAPDQSWYAPAHACDAAYWLRVQLLAESGSDEPLEELVEELVLVQRLSI